MSSLSPARLTKKVAVALHLKHVDLELLDPVENPNITLELRPDAYSEEVNFARNWYHEVWMNSKRGTPWDCTIKCLFANPEWSFAAATACHHEEEVIIAPEEVLENGTVHLSDQWIADHQVPRRTPSNAKEKLKHVVDHVKGISMGRRRASTVGSSAPSEAC